MRQGGLHRRTRKGVRAPAGAAERDLLPPRQSAIAAEPLGAQRPARILLGHIASAHGIRGEVLVRSYAATPENIVAYGPLSDETGARRFELSVVGVTSKGIVARIAGVCDRNSAEALAGQRLYVARERLPTAGEQEFYYSDLVGLRVSSENGAVLGEVIAVHNFGAGDIVEIRRRDGRTTEMIPFTRMFVPEVDLAGGRLVVALPAASQGRDGEPDASLAG